MKKAILIGAGFSYDLGMPLASELSSTFFGYLSPARCNAIKVVLKKNEPFGKDRPIDRETIDEGFQILEQYRDQDYEAFLNKIESLKEAYHANQAINDTYHYLYAVFYDMVYQLLYMHQTVSFGPYYKKNFELYKGLLNFLSNQETWIFSLNHDLIVEFLTAEYSIPLSYGDIDSVSFPLHNLSMGTHIDFSRTRVVDYSLDKMKFFRDCRGINLLKLHGGLGEFVYHDQKERLNMDIGGRTSDEILQTLVRIVQEMGFFIHGNKVGGIKDKIVTNMEGQLDVIQAAVLAGGHKYGPTLKLRPGEEKLRILEQALSSFDELHIIGYGFRDQHINLRLYNAMLLNNKMKMWVVNPHSIKIPDSLIPFDYDMRVRTAKAGTPEWLDFVKDEKWDPILLKKVEDARKERSSFVLKI